MTRRRFSPQEIDTIRRMAETERLPPDQIAAAHGINVQYLRVLASRNHIQLPKSTTRPAPRPRPQDGLLHRIAARAGLSPERDTVPLPVEESTLDAWLADPRAFFDWLGFHLYPYQNEALDLILANDRTVIVWPRAHGKDTLTALYSLYVAVTRPGAIIVCCSPSQRQSDLWLTTFKSLTHAQRELREQVVDESQSEMAFANESRVYSLPAGAQGSATIRGFQRVSVVVANECAWIDAETFRAFTPFMAVTGKSAKLILASTPFGQSGPLWQAFNNDVYARHHVTEIKNPLISADFIEKERASMDALSFASEWGAIFLSSQSAYFPADLIERCVESYPLVESPLPQHQGMTFYLGCDWARIEGADKSVFTVVGIDAEGHGRVLWVKSFDGLDYVSQVSYIEWLHRQWGFRAIYADQSNHAAVDMLTKMMLPVLGVNFTVPSKVEMFGRLKNGMEAAKITLPNHPDLLRELSTFEYKISDHGNLLLHHRQGGHDDYPDSLALAAQAVTMDTSQPEIGFILVDQDRHIVADLTPKRATAKASPTASGYPILYRNCGIYGDCQELEDHVKVDVFVFDNGRVEGGETWPKAMWLKEHGNRFPWDS